MTNTTVPCTQFIVRCANIKVLGSVRTLTILCSGVVSSRPFCMVFARSPCAHMGFLHKEPQNKNILNGALFYPCLWPVMNCTEMLSSSKTSCKVVFQGICRSAAFCLIFYFWGGGVLSLSLTNGKLLLSSHWDTCCSTAHRQLTLWELRSQEVRGNQLGLTENFLSCAPLMNIHTYVSRGHPPKGPYGKPLNPRPSPSESCLCKITRSWQPLIETWWTFST